MKTLCRNEVTFEILRVKTSSYEFKGTQTHIWGKIRSYRKNGKRGTEPGQDWYTCDDSEQCRELETLIRCHLWMGRKRRRTHEGTLKCKRKNGRPSVPHSWASLKDNGQGSVSMRGLTV